MSWFFGGNSGPPHVQLQPVLLEHSPPGSPTVAKTLDGLISEVSTWGDTDDADYSQLSDHVDVDVVDDDDDVGDEIIDASELDVSGLRDEYCDLPSDDEYEPPQSWGGWLDAVFNGSPSDQEKLILQDPQALLQRPLMITTALGRSARFPIRFARVDGHWTTVRTDGKHHAAAVVTVEQPGVRPAEYKPDEHGVLMVAGQPATPRRETPTLRRLKRVPIKPLVRGEAGRLLYNILHLPVGVEYKTPAGEILKRVSPAKFRHGDHVLVIDKRASLRYASRRGRGGMEQKHDWKLVTEYDRMLEEVQRYDATESELLRRQVDADVSAAPSWYEQLWGPEKPVPRRPARPPPRNSARAGLLDDQRRRDEEEQRAREQEHRKLVARELIAEQEAEKERARRAARVQLETEWRCVVGELATTEATYADMLAALSRAYASRLVAEGHINQVDRQGIFGPVDELAQVHAQLARDARAYCDTHCDGEPADCPDDLPPPPAFLAIVASKSELYKMYINSYSAGQLDLQRRQASQPKLAACLDAAKRLRDGLSVYDHMIVPVQRLPRYVMLVEQMASLLRPAGHSPTLAAIMAMASSIKRMTDDINECKRHADAKAARDQAYSLVIERELGALTIDNPNRTLVDTATVYAVGKHPRSKPYRMLVFSDYVLLLVHTKAVPVDMPGFDAPVSTDQADVGNHKIERLIKCVSISVASLLEDAAAPPTVSRRIICIRETSGRTAEVRTATAVRAKTLIESIHKAQSYCAVTSASVNASSYLHTRPPERPPPNPPRPADDLTLTARRPRAGDRGTLGKRSSVPPTRPSRAVSVDLPPALQPISQSPVPPSNSRSARLKAAAAARAAAGSDS